MESVSLSREIAAPAATVRDAIEDVETFMRAAEFDEVTVADGTIEIANTVGFLRIELALDMVDRPGAILAYEQREGIFEVMDTEYRLEETGDGTTVTATTEYAVDAAFVGPVFDATVVKRQRRRELGNQFDHLQATCE
ncbi:MAG: SRPBCC family protein [Halobacteriales archaeon]